MEISTYELSVFAVLSFFAGAFASIYISRLLDVIHTWRIVNEAILSILWMLTKITEDMAFLQELKLKQMRQSGFTPEQISKFKEVDDHFLTNWKESAIVSIVKRAPRHFKSMIPFYDWNSAVRHLFKTLKGENN
jgi:hypothetical protein